MSACNLHGKFRVEKAWIIAMVEDAYPLKENVFVTPLDEFLEIETE